MTYIIIIIAVAALVTVAALISSTFRKYVKWIGGGIIAIGGAILVIATLGKKKSDQKSDTKISADKDKITTAEGNVDHDLTNIGHTDAEITASKVAEQALADKAKKDQEALDKKPDKPDQGKAGDDFLDTYKKP